MGEQDTVTLSVRSVRRLEKTSLTPRPIHFPVMRLLNSDYDNEESFQQGLNCSLLTHSPLNRPCGSTSFLPLVTSSVLTVKANFVR